jgi:hypothetical protein
MCLSQAAALRKINAACSTSRRKFRKLSTKLDMDDGKEYLFLANP